MRNEPHGSPSKHASPPPGGPGQPDVGLRGKLTGKGAGGADPEELAAEIGLWPSDVTGAGGSSASGSGVCGRGGCGCGVWVGASMTTFYRARSSTRSSARSRRIHRGRRRPIVRTDGPSF